MKSEDTKASACVRLAKYILHLHENSGIDLMQFNILATGKCVESVNVAR